MERIETRQFTDALEMSEALAGHVTVAQMFKGTERIPPVVYVLSEDGTQFSTSRLFEETLTDGSKVYHIVLSA